MAHLSPSDIAAPVAGSHSHDSRNSPASARQSACEVSAYTQPTHISSYDIVRFILGPILLFAAILKGHDIATEASTSSGVLWPRWFSIVLVLTEIIMGVWLLAGVFRARCRLGAIILFAIFTVVSLGEALMGYNSCGCFGAVAVNPWPVAGLDFSALIALVAFPPATACSSVARPTLSTFPPGVVATAVSLVLLTAALGGLVHITRFIGHAKITGTPLALLDPEDWIGKRLPLLTYLRADESLAIGSKALLFYHPDCPKCREAVAHYCHLPPPFSDGLTARIFLVNLSIQPQHKSMLIDEVTCCVAADLDSHKEWVMQTPVLVTLEDGMVTDIRLPDEVSKDITNNKGLE